MEFFNFFFFLFASIVLALPGNEQYPPGPRTCTTNYITTTSLCTVPITTSTSPFLVITTYDHPTISHRTTVPICSHRRRAPV